MGDLDPSGDDLIVDIETNGFQHKGQKIHCIEAIHIQSGTQFHAADQPGFMPISEMLQILQGADHLIGHNIAVFDLPCITRIYGTEFKTDKIIDTLILSRVTRAGLTETDEANGLLSGKLKGSHSLEAWGSRLGMSGLAKDDFKHQQDQPWSLALQEHCATDTLLQWALYLELREADSQAFSFLQSAWYALETHLIPITNLMSETGFPVDVVKAHALLEDLTTQSGAFAETLQRMLPPVEVLTAFTPKRNNVKKGWVAGQTIMRGKEVPFNVNSGLQFAARMIERHGWQPTVLTDGGDPSITAAVLATLDYPEAKLLSRYKVATKRISMLQGDNGYLTKLSDDNRLHTEYLTLGARTGRASHRPNVAQVPSVLLGGDDLPLYGAEGGWGYEFRDMFVAPPGWVLVGSDQKGIEARLLGHFLARWDGGEYANQVCNGADMHEQNRHTTGVSSRAKAKRLLYATIYGCGNRKAGTIVDGDEDDDLMLSMLGKMAKDALIGGIRGFAELFEWLNQLSVPLPGLDGRPLFPRKDYARLNTIIQASGAIICKAWVLLIDAALKQRGLGADDYALMAWVHDEVVLACRPDLAETIAQVCKDAAVQAGEVYHLQCPTAANAAIGMSWATIH